MALKNLFDMVKADRYTADGREALIKAQEAETEDQVYNIGDISRKTGLMKTANGWVKPPKGKQPGAKNAETKHPPMVMPEGMSPAAFMKAWEDDAQKHGFKKGQGNEWREHLRNEEAGSKSGRKMSNGEISERKTKGISVEGIGEGKSFKNENGAKIDITGTGADGSIQFMVTTSEGTKQSHHARSKEEMERILSVNGYEAESKPATGNNLPDIPDFKGMESGDYDKKLRAEGWTTGGWEGSGTHASAIFKKGDRTIRVNEGQPGKITSVQEISKPAAGKLPSGVKSVKMAYPREKLDFGKGHYIEPNSEPTKEADALVRNWFESEGKEILPDLYVVNESGDAKAFTTRAGLVNKLRYMIANDKPYDLVYISKNDATSAQDAAPRVLTGDTRIRVRKA